MIAVDIETPRGRVAGRMHEDFSGVRDAFVGNFAKRGEIGAEELQDMMAGGREMVELESSLGGTV